MEIQPFRDSYRQTYISGVSVDSAHTVHFMCLHAWKCPRDFYLARADPASKSSCSKLLTLYGFGSRRNRLGCCNRIAEIRIGIRYDIQLVINCFHNSSSVPWVATLLDLELGPDKSSSAFDPKQMLRSLPYFWMLPGTVCLHLKWIMYLPSVSFYFSVEFSYFYRVCSGFHLVVFPFGAGCVC